MKNNMISISKLAKSFIDFLSLPFRNLENYSSKTVEELNLECMISRLEKPKFSRIDESNHCVSDGKVRINVLFNQALNFAKDSEVLISTTKLDSDLYSERTMSILRSMLANDADSVKILHSEDSENLASLSSTFVNASIKKLEESDIEKLGRFIISENSLSLEITQKYNTQGKLSKHTADFHYNLDLDESEKTKSLKQKSKELEINFHQKMHPVNC